MSYFGGFVVRICRAVSTFSFTSNQGSSHILGYVAFVFRCTDQHEANELKILTFSLVYQINDRWKVDLDGLELRADPPVEKEGGSKIIGI